MNRRNLLKIGAAHAALASIPAAAAAGRAQAPSQPGSAAHPITLRNNAFELELRPGSQLHCRVLHRPTGALLADGPYSYSCEPFAVVIARKTENSVVFQGTTPTGLAIEHRFQIDPAGPSSGHGWFEEQITLRNLSTVPMDLSAVRFGFVLPVPLHSGQAAGPWATHVFTAIPFRRESNGNRTQYADFSLTQLLTGQFSSEVWTAETTVTPAFASEGWAATDGGHGLLFSKYSPAAMEFALLDRVTLPGSQIALRWGGAGIYRGVPEHGAWLLPGESHQFGVSRLSAFTGGLTQGFYAFRAEMEMRGHGCPQDFNPPVHWNELYDNKLWWRPEDQQDSADIRKQYYTLNDMKLEAAKAKEIGCEALYMDPGWDTNFGSKIWDDARLGPYPAFTAMLARDYGLKSSLHTPLSGWCNPSSMPLEAHRVDRFGRRLVKEPEDGFWQSPLCGASEQYVTETAKRLKVLAAGGAAYFMFDGTAYHGECWDPNHGHRVPARMEEHVRATCNLARMVHADFPNVLIEMHDPIRGGDRCRVVPIYYGHGPAPQGEPNTPAPASPALGFDSVWAFELMWMPLRDLLSGRAIALYYYNLAYSLPLYIHIDLRTDNANALVFWWNASTCRHLGIGGTHPDPAVRQAQKAGMAQYRRLKPYFASGVFYGIDEQTHVHSSRDGSSAVINCFNLEPGPVEREIHFDPALLGLSGKKVYQFSTGAFHPDGSAWTGKVQIPAHGHTLIEIS